MKKNITVLSWVVLLAFTGCDSESDSDDKNSFSGEIQKLAPMLAEQCGIISACAETSVNNCMGTMADDDAYEFGVLPHLSIALQQRGSCLADAQNCTEVNACDVQFEVDAFSHASKIETKCTNKEEAYCEDDVFVWCYLGEYETAAVAIAYDLSLSGKTCNSSGTGPADPEHKSCQVGADGYSPKLCDGDFVTRCEDGELVSYDCKQIDSAFTCYLRDGDSAECGIPPATAECETNTYNNQGDDGWCEQDVAVSCVNGKKYQTDCSQIAGGTCVSSEYNATCKSEKFDSSTENY